MSCRFQFGGVNVRGHNIISCQVPPPTSVPDKYSSVRFTGKKKHFERKINKKQFEFMSIFASGLPHRCTEGKHVLKKKCQSEGGTF